MSMQNPRLVGQDATISSTSALLTFYEKMLTRTWHDNAKIVQFLGSRNINQPGALTLSWKKERKAKLPSTSLYGDEENAGNFTWDPITSNFVSTNQMYHIKKYELDQAKLTNINLETESARVIGNSIAEAMDANIWLGVVGPPVMTALSTVTGVTDVGAPAGVWDTTSNAYNDILKILDAVRNKGWDGPINLLGTPGLIKILMRFISDGTTTMPFTVKTWLAELLNGGTVTFGSHFAERASAPTLTDKLTGTGGVAENVLVAAAPGAAKVVFAHSLQSFKRPAQEGDVYRNVKVKYTFEYPRPELIGWMNAIDTTA